MVTASGAYFAAQAFGSTQAQNVAGIALVLIWSLAAGEPIVRFWLVARDLPAVQAWRLRSLSLGFGGLVAILMVAAAAGSIFNDPLTQVMVELIVLVIVPLLYVSFSPPAWLRREWRASEEEGLRVFMEDLVLSEDRDALTKRALEWAMRLVGGAAAIFFDPSGKPRYSSELTQPHIDEVSAHLPGLSLGIQRVAFDGSDSAVLVLPVTGLEGTGKLIILAGPFTPGFGGDEMNRVQQFMSAFVTASTADIWSCSSKRATRDFWKRISTRAFFSPT
jgi:hypothetical protein